MEAATLVDPADFVRMHTRRMQQAAAELQFEAAGKIKAYVDQLSQLGKGPFRHARLLKDFQFVSFQHGPRAGTVRVFLIARGRIAEVACMITEPRWPAELLGILLHAAETAGNVRKPIDPVGAERIGIVAHHLFSGKPGQGTFVRLDELNEKGIIRAYRDLLKRPADEAGEVEGVLKELQSL